MNRPAPAASLSDRSQPEVQRTFWVVLLSRLALNMQMRVIYPFLPAISRALNVPLGTTSLLLTARAAANLSSPLYGALADRLGRRALMLSGLLILTAGTLWVALAPSFQAVLLAVAFLSLCKAVYDPAVLAYLGDSVPYEKRGRMMGILAMMWPAAWLVGVPLAAVLIDRVNWRAPFLLIGLLGALSLALTLRFRTVGATHSAEKRMPGLARPPRLAWKPPRIPRQGWFALAVTLLLLLASENVYIVYGAWLESQFHLSLTGLGLASLVICAAEFTAEGFSSAWVDRIGKRRAVLGGLALNILANLLLPPLAGALSGALLGLFLVYLTYDFSIVSTLPLLSELAPKARGTLLSLNVAAMAAGRLLSSLTAVRLWASGGLAANTALSALASLAALLILAGLIREAQAAVQPLPAD